MICNALGRDCQRAKYKYDFFSLLLSFLLFLIIIIFREVALRNYTAVAGFSRFYMAKVAMCGVESAAKGSNRGRGVRGASDTVLGIFKQ